ncbi:DUF1007 family protein [Bartonella tamiae]|uniref:EF-hand domain-containing protein n=1 Tax=Bartonella tamiae Th239 TaxID=1094558 RepID=J0R4H9_9HYPH|nr:DUF1007 family protein [Bartonella tamiae]EJF90564.1 hypothetical protein ME5_00965 [Bartonella tamiae Th239]EJF94058.1 hypothetical protein MEG_00916 [Bartonella tamiae Th307]
MLISNLQGFQSKVFRSLQRNLYLVCLSFMLLYVAFFSFIEGANAHPHIFVDAYLNIKVNNSAVMTSMTQKWIFDPIFSSGVVLDFDKNGDRKLDKDELDEVSKIIKDSLGEYDYFQSLTKDGVTIPIAAPDFIKAEIIKQQLVLSFTVTPVTKTNLEKGHKYNFSLYDPTFYVAVDFAKQQNLTVTGLPSYCVSNFIRPDIDKVLSTDYSQQTEDFFNDPQQSFNLALSLATQLEVLCD